MKQTDVLFILSNGRVAAVGKWDGNILWEIKLKKYAKGIMGSSPGQISIDGDKLYIGVSGILLCLSVTDGSLIWKNELKGWGYQFISIANAGNEAAAAYVQAQANAAAASVAVTAAAG